MFKSKDSKPPWRGYDRNDVVGLLVAQLAERYSHSTTKKKSLEQFGEFWGADLSLISDRAELLDALNRRTSDEVQYWHQHANDRWERQAKTWWRGLSIPERDQLYVKAQDMWLLHVHGRTMLDEVRSERALRERRRAEELEERQQKTAERDLKAVQEDFAACYAELLEFAAANGRTHIFREEQTETPLKWWLSLVRGLHRKGVMRDRLPDVAAKLEAIPGWSWESEPPPGTWRLSTSERG